MQNLEPGLGAFCAVNQIWPILQLLGLARSAEC